jgi:signal transduction histidine kinase
VTSQNLSSDVSSTAVLESEHLSTVDERQRKDRILVVDDEEAVVGALSEFFTLRGYEVESALNSRQALGIIHDKEFSIVISDLRMPGMNGVELLEHVMDTDPETVVIIMTGYASVQSAVDALKKGAYDYVVKPFSMYELEKTVRLGLEKRRLLRENVELSHLTRKLIEIDQIKSDIIGTVSHEFRTPLMSLKGYLSMMTQFLAEGKDTSTTEKTWLRAMKDNLGRLEMLILNLLLMTEANAGDLLITTDRIDLSQVIGESISRVDPLTKTKEIAISFDQTDDGKLLGDAEKLGVAVTNILENAIKFNLESGAVKIGMTGTSEPDGVRLSILDTGIGIPDNKIGSIFNSFTQGDMTHTRRFAGAGLGLSVAKAIVEAHGGSIDVVSKPGQGSTFHVWLPRRCGGEHGDN